MGDDAVLRPGVGQGLQNPYQLRSPAEVATRPRLRRALAEDIGRSIARRGRSRGDERQGTTREQGEQQWSSNLWRISSRPPIPRTARMSSSVDYWSPH